MFSFKREEISTMGKKAQKPRALEVEIIYGKRIKNGHTEYWIKWKGFPEKDSTWENVTRLEVLYKRSRKQNKPHPTHSPGVHADLGAISASGK